MNEIRLTQGELAALRDALDRRYAALLEEVRDELERSENQQYVEQIGRGPVDSADASIADALADLNLDIIDRHIGELRDIEAARSRMKEGSFGICIDCACEIPFGRLLAYPTAKRCVACQGKRERGYASEGTPTL